MRHQGQAKLGFYPAHADAIAGILKHLKLPEAGLKGIQILDPCAGQGAAIKQIADGLGIPHKSVYCVELSKERAELCKEAMPEANVVGLASYAGTWITQGSFGLAYVNPPFDDELGGGRREEYSFARRAWGHLVVGGVLVLVAPIRAVNGNSNFCDFLDSCFEDIRIFMFPDHVRNFNEIVIIGRKRKEELSQNAVYTLGTLRQADFNYRTYGWERELSRVGDEHYWSQIKGRRYKKEPSPTYELKTAWKPHKFAKTAYLDDDLYADLGRSPLNRLVKEYFETPMARPPLPPGKGHIALLLASGKLDGVVEGEDGNHVVRGTATKVEYYNEAASKSTVDEESGAVTTKDVYSQRVSLVLRGVWPDGVIHTFSDEPPKPGEEEEEEKPYQPEPGDSTTLLDKLEAAEMLTR